jgi:hypothetical protein
MNQLAGQSGILHGDDSARTGRGRRDPELMRLSGDHGGTADHSSHLLVLADVWCQAKGLCDEVLRRAGDADRVLVVAPALASRLHTWTNDTDRESEVAHARLENVLARLEEHGIRAEGRIAAQDPALAVEDALDAFPATEVIVVTEDHEHANWSERGLTPRIARRGLTVTRLTVAHEQTL